ncbi:hypothetical protein AC622_10800 [Bacillus sp. FJAT-27916]|uniref:hypothetical protein n=1 Tax=Bacillus sp. FJAT-27916 TaxID=1679169 RepID=UPI0006707D50|nr:hypothetical protein [Bacillus sp. FJAT-27916]KMY44672.1 hypothetical protein AC622_10800 [Bacillus sp. FJAT-27916]
MKRIVLMTGLLSLSTITVSSAIFSLETWYEQQLGVSMTNVITDSEDTMTRSIYDYNKFTTALMNDGSTQIYDQTTKSFTASSANINKYSEEYIKQIQSTTNTLKTTRYNQLVNEHISQHNQEIDEEVTDILAEILN